MISFSVLHWVVDQKGALQSMKGSLKPGGMMLLVVPGRSPTSTSLLGEKLTRRDKWVKFFPNFKLDRVYFTVDEYRSLLEEVGLEVDSITQFETVAFFKNKVSLIDWIRPLMNFIDHLDAEQQDAFLEEIVDEILLVYPENSDGSIQPHHLTTKVIARKGS